MASPNWSPLAARKASPVAEPLTLQAIARQRKLTPEERHALVRPAVVGRIRQGINTHISKIEARADCLSDAQRARLAALAAG